MSKKRIPHPRPREQPPAINPPVPGDVLQGEFAPVLAMIEAAQARTMTVVNAALIDHYWDLGAHLCARVASDGWGRGTVEELAGYIRARRPNAIGYSASNLWRMRQFFEAYRDAPKLAPLVREVSWSHNLLILGRCKRDEEREFYLRVCHRERWGRRELERQLAGGLFERTMLSPVHASPAMERVHPGALSAFKDVYLVDFLELPSPHSESDLERALIERLKQFLMELGRDFCFVGSQYVLQVGGRDFAVDLLFFNRELNCLVAFELKIDEFQPSYLGQLEFYLEALDRDVRKPHEGPSIGVLLCASKDQEVVEYALARSASPALVAEYQTRLPDKRLLERKLHEFYELSRASLVSTGDAPGQPGLPRRGRDRRV